ncbi:MAG: YicC family protein [Phycisphaerales bacterium]|nr:YicC family protein [Phycisphaerales bacterium]
MLHSMTGFGEARLEEGGLAYQVELRSVNNRYFKGTVYLPEDFGFLEAEVERWLRERLTRGSVTLRATVRAMGAQAAPKINVPALRAYLGQLQAALGADQRPTIDLAALLELPGVCEPSDLSDTARAHKQAILEKLTREALDRLVTMRAAEGQTIERDLREQCRRIRAALDVIRGRCELVVAEYRDRLLSRVQQLIAGSGIQLAEQDVLKEVSIYAERSDISEELTRLDAHLEQFSAATAGDEPPGRKLEFIAQEMLREANTMGSKTGDPEISRQIVEIKSAVDRIKEQVQNAE